MGVIAALSDSKSFAQFEMVTLTQIAQATEQELKSAAEVNSALQVENAKLQSEQQSQKPVLDIEQITNVRLLFIMGL